MKIDVVALIHKPFPDEAAVLHEAAAQIESVSRTEFYKAKSVGILPSAVFSVLTPDYHGENALLYGGTLWRVERAYETQNNRTELTCSGVELGQKNCVIYLLTQTVTQDREGYPTTTTETSPKLYAYRQEKSVTETDTRAGTVALKTETFIFEQDGRKINHKMQIFCENITFDILSILEIPGREEFVEVTARGRVS